jgi:LuxR family maltose regulon positive regulatory protein
MMAGDLDEMQRRLDEADAALATGADDPATAATWADTEDLRTAPATVWVYRAALAQAHGDVEATRRSARHALELARTDDHFLHGAAAGFLGLAAWAAGDVREALATFSDAVRSLHAAGNLVDELDSTVVLGDMWVTAGRPGRARGVYERALETATGSGEPYPRATPDLHVGLAELDGELNDLAGADAHLETARVLARRSSITENRHRWFVAAARVRAAAGDHAAASRLLDQAETLYRPGFYPDVRPIAALRARLHLIQGDLAAAEAWAVDHGDASPDAVTFLDEYNQLTLVRIQLARHRRNAAVPGHVGPDDPAALGRTLSLLDRWEADAEPARAGSLLEIRMLRSLALEAGGRRAAALTELERALTGAPEPDGYVRLFLDEGAPMLALLHHAADEREGAVADELRRHARRILDAARSGEPPAALAPEDVARTGRGQLPDPLSDREVEVLRLLDSTLTGPEIARRLYVSLNTFRTHTKRIFTKLDVNTRAAAVRRGRELHLL